MYTVQVLLILLIVYAKSCMTLKFNLVKQTKTNKQTKKLATYCPGLSFHFYGWDRRNLNRGWDFLFMCLSTVTYCRRIQPRPPALEVETFTAWATREASYCRRKWQPTPVFLPGESQGWGSLVGCRLWGRTESDTTEAT